METSGGSKGGGGATGAHPPKIESTSVFFIQFTFFIRMLNNKAQIARESIIITLELPGPKRALDPCQK